MACRGLLLLVCYGLMASPGSFPSCLEEDDPDSMSGQDLDPDKPVWSTYCREDVTDPSFCLLFCVFHPDSMTCATDPRVGYLVCSSGTPPEKHVQIL